MKRWVEFRLNLIRWLRHVSSTPEGCLSPRWIVVIHHILFPFNWLYERQSNVKYDAFYDIYTIRGINITGCVFDMFQYEVGNRFQVVKSKDGIVTIRKETEITLPMHEN